MIDLQSMTADDLRDLLADLDRAIGDGSECRTAEERLAWEIEEELHRRHLEQNY